MRTSTLSLLCAIVVTTVAGCTVKDVDQPALAGPSTFAISIKLEASPDTLAQNGASASVIRITALDPNGQPVTRSLFAQITVDGIPQDFGTLSTKNPVTNGQPLVYTAPAAPTIATAQTAQTVTIAVTPSSSGDFRSEFARTVDIRLVPPGVILPSNPNLVADFLPAPSSPEVFTNVVFDAAAGTLNGGSPCGTQCTYAWNFGDGTTANGINVTHQYRTAGTFQATLTVTDSRGAQATRVRTVTVLPGTPPDAKFTMTPNPVGINQDVFFNAEQSTVVLPRRIVNYGWSFGDGRTASGVSVARSFSTVGSYPIILTVTDDAGTVGRSTPQTLTVSAAGAGLTPLLTVSPSSASVAGTTLFFNASGSSGTAPIVEYRFNWGDGSPDDVGVSATQSHAFPAGTGARTYQVRLTIRDSLGRTATIVLSVAVT